MKKQNPARRLLRRSFFAVVIAIAAGSSFPATAQEEGRSPLPLDLEKGDHIAIVGNVLADRMQHGGYLETLIQGSHPDHELVFRNLAASGDEVDTWFRSDNFGSRDEWLERVEADVVFAFYGYNESVEGAGGLAEFREELGEFIVHLRSRDYSGRGAPALVLFSPIANERHQDPNFPDPGESNRRIAVYTEVMREVAAEHGVTFVDLWGPSREMFASAAEQGTSLTVNGHYLKQEGYRLLAPVMFRELFGVEPPAGNWQMLRAAVLEKNRQWHSLYRIIDGYNIYGDRSALAYSPDEPGYIMDRHPPEPRISNFEVMQQELAQREVMTANRDKRIWALAGGNDIAVDDSNLPPVTSVPTNEPGPNDGEHVILGGEEAIEKMELYPGLEVNLFASEEQFPRLANPVQMAWDTRGRLWVAVWPAYPGRTPTGEISDSLLVFEDNDHDGRADKVTTFATGLNAPTGFQFYKGGVLVMQAPDLWYLKDTDGDGKADWKERVLMGMDSADSHHTANSLAYDPGGAIYLSDGVFHRTQVETFWGPVRNFDGGIYRFEPNTGRFETFVSYGFANPHGRVFDRWGNGFITDATGNNTYFGPAFSGRLDLEHGKHPGMKTFWDRPARPAAGTGILTSRHFPEELQGNFLNLNVISFQGIYNVDIQPDGSGLIGETKEPILRSDDPNFIPTDVAIGPDGALYVSDWQNPIVGHMQHHLRDPSRDKTHGRIYRITAKNRPLLEQPRIHGAPIPDLLDLLREPEDHVRELAKIELAKHDSADVIAAVGDWVQSLNTKDPDYEHHLMEALWVHQWQNVVNIDLLDRMLASPNPQARAAAGRVLCYWRERVPESLDRFRKLARDDHPRVRLEAVRGASFYRNAEAAEVALAVLEKPMDYYLEYTLTETLRQLEPYWRQAFEEGAPPALENPAALERLVGAFELEELQQLPQTVPVLRAIVTRAEASNSDRLEALRMLAAVRDTNFVMELLAALTEVETDSGDAMARLLPTLPVSQLADAREALVELAVNGRSSGIRQSAWAAIVVADGEFDSAWQAADSPETLTDLVAAIPAIPNPQLRGKAYDRVREVLGNAQSAPTSERVQKGRFIRIELPRTGTLTLAEVEVLSDGENVAPAGTASQSSVAYSGVASRAIDGETAGVYSRGTSTHTEENEMNPWWEVDLGRERPIDSIGIWNRTDEEFGKRLEGYTLTVLDGERNTVFKREQLAAPDPKSTINVTAPDPAEALRRAAIAALVSMPGHSDETFEMLVELIVEGREVVAAARGIRAVPREAWTEAGGRKVVAALIDWAKTIPVSRRTSRDYVETIQTAGELAPRFLPGSEIERELRNLRVAVFVIRTIPEQMRFDTKRIVVEPGQAFEVIFENPDFMPHNLVFVQPGTRRTIGMLASQMGPEDLDAQGRAFVPSRPEVIAATRLLEAGESATLQIIAPEEEGVYEFVCTFPGHWAVMWGELIVTSRNGNDPATSFEDGELAIPAETDDSDQAHGNPAMSGH